MGESLDSLGEDSILNALFPLLPSNEQLLVGAGDDCAVAVRDQVWDTLLKTDVVVENVHFLRDTPPNLIGRKALARCVSDIAAMGGIPEHALITILVHRSRSLVFLKEIYEGLSDFARQQGISIAGGETSSLPYDGLAISVSLTGRVEHGQAVLRSTGRPGDILCVSGRLGGSFPSERHLRFEPRVCLARKLLFLGLRPTAMMDISDGLSADLPKLARASRCGFQIEKKAVPCHDGCSFRQAMDDGEDYELLMAFAPEIVPMALSAHLPHPITPIGRLIEGDAVRLQGGWQHFCA